MSDLRSFVVLPNKLPKNLVSNLFLFLLLVPGALGMRNSAGGPWKEAAEKPGAESTSALRTMATPRKLL